jgi:hypothetical protein
MVEDQEDEVRPASNDGRRPRPKQFLRRQMQMRQGDGENSRRPAPLTAWEEYAHALLQANETSFVN